MALNITQTCLKCLGTGIYQRTTGPVDPCPMCNGAGTIDIPDLVDDAPLQIALATIMDKLNTFAIAAIRDEISDVMDKCNDIKEKCDETMNKCDQIWDKVKTL